MTEHVAHGVQQERGIAGMREHMEWPAGSFRIGSWPGRDTVVEVRLPRGNATGRLR